MKTRHLLYISILSFLVFTCDTNDQQKVEIIKFDQLERLISQESDELTVINFWATWCAPCIKELPYFEALASDPNSNIKVSLISLDFREDFEKKVLPFIEKRNIKSDVFLLDEIDYNSWIDKVDSTWSGAIPATLIINSKTDKRTFVEKELSDGELEELIAKTLNP